jgi:N4-gp56 family major capsid protein
MNSKLTVIAGFIGALFHPGVTNSASGFQSDVEAYIQEEVEPLARRQLVAYQFGKPLRLDINRGTTYTASRYERLPLPYAALQEGVAPPGESMSLSQVTATAQQWGDLVRITDVANLTIKHPLFQQAIQLVSLQMPETLERNTMQTLLAGNQINYVNSRASRALLVATDVLSPTEIYRAVGSMETYGVPHFMGDEREDLMIEAGTRKDMSRSPAVMQHYVALIHPLPVQDMKSNATVANAWAQSDVNRLYNNDLGEWGGVRFCKSNMVPYFVGVADPATNTGATQGGALAANTYFIQITGAPAQTSVEQRIYQVSAGVVVGGAGQGSITVVLPTLANYVFNVYIGTSATPTNLGLSASGPSTGPLAGQATQLPSGSTVVITGIGAAQTPPAAPATGVSVFPTIVIGNHSYGQVLLENPEFNYLTGADKSDPLNQTRVVSWKVFYGSIILNQAFFMRIESSSAFTPGYSAGTVLT